MSDIDPQEFGRLQAEVSALRRDNDRMLALLERLDGRLEGISQQLSQAKGGWKMLVGIGAAVGAVIAMLVTYFSGR